MGLQQLDQGERQEKPSKESLDELLQALKAPKSEEQRQQVLTILKASPSLMAAFIQHRAVHQALIQSPAPGLQARTTGPSPLKQKLDKDEAYREKIKHLIRYLEPLRTLLQRVQRRPVHQKLNKLIYILSNSAKICVPLEILLKCEEVLEKIRPIIFSPSVSSFNLLHLANKVR